MSAFAFAILPDTQKYAQSFPATALAQTQWIADNKVALNIIGVAHLGDIVESGGTVSEWEAMDAAFDVLDAASIPYACAWGNHDDLYASSTKHYDYFGSERYTGQTGFVAAGVLSTANPPRTYAVAMDFPNDIRVIATGYLLAGAGLDDRTTVDAEAGDDDIQNVNRDKRLLQFIRDHAQSAPTKKVLVIFHAFLRENGTVRPGCDWIMEHAIAPHANIFAVINGHELGSTAEAYLPYTVNAGTGSERVVHLMLSNYQSRTAGGDGWLRLWVFDPDTNTFDVQTYSPTLDEFEADASSYIQGLSY